MDTGDFTQAPLVRVVDVFKDGSHLDFRPSAYTVEESDHWLATGQRPQRGVPPETDPTRRVSDWVSSGPCTPEQAIAIARAAGLVWRRPDGTPGPLKAQEFSHGYAVYMDKPKPTRIDFSRPPADLAGPVGAMVIDKADGHVTVWPPLAVDVIAKLYLRDGRYTGRS